MREKQNRGELFQRVKARGDNILEKEKELNGHDLKCRPIGRYGQKKLQFIRSYLYIYSTIVSANFNRFWYIETCSGPGICKTKGSGRLVMGTPLLAMTNEPFFTGHKFIELDEACAESLDIRHEVYCLDVDAEVIRGNCNEVFQSVLGRIPTGDRFLVVMDPEGLELKWDTTIVPTSKMPRSEMFINFTYDMAVKRCASRQCSPAHKRSVTEYMGTHEWIPLRDKYLAEEITSRELRERFLGLYTRRLKEAGFPFVTVSNVVRSDGGQPLYYLISASRQPITQKIMNDVMKKGNHVQTRLPNET